MGERRCPECGAEQRGDGERLGCPVCLFGLGLAPGSDDTTLGAGDPRDPTVPERVGPYRILRRLGAGGMGVVYLAEQDEPIRREVALKVVRPGMADRDVIRRFEHERRTLALMDHPSIARVFDAGETLDGLPYFVMEYVDGIPITAYCDRERLATTERIRLLAQACAAVEHAHRRGVIHRDVKPGNVLVATDADGASRVKVIDFGVARAVDRPADDATLLTQAGFAIGTPAYMSPEQAAGDGARIDTRTDVYGLGVVLYELLTGALPFDPAELLGHGIDQMRRRIREDDPPTPSARVSRLADGGRASAGSRRVDPARLCRELRGELDWIVMRALEKQPERRYGSAAALGDDLRRYLDDEPVAAGPPSAAYRVVKFCRRHRVLVGSGAAVVAALVLGAVVSVIFAVGQHRALLESERQRAVATAVGEFLTKDVLGRANPVTGSLPDTTLREVVHAAAASIDTGFEDEPEVRASVRLTIAKVFFELGEHAAAAEHAGLAAASFADVLGDAAEKTVDARHVQFLALRSDTRYEEADAVLQRNLAVADDIADRLPRLHAIIYTDLGTLRRRQTRYAESERAYARAVELLEESGADARVLAIARGNYGLALFSQSRYEAAERAMRAAVEDFTELQGPDSVDVAFVLNNLGHAIMKGHDDEAGHARAREVFERAYDIRVRRLGPTHPETLRTRGSLGTLAVRAGDYAEAERIHREVLADRLGIMGPEQLDVMESRNSLAEALLEQGKLDEARDVARETYATAAGVLGPHHPRAQFALDLWESALRESGDAAGVARVRADWHAAVERYLAEEERSYLPYLELAEDLLTCDVESLRNPARALELTERARTAEGGETSDTYELLARSLAANGRTGEALDAGRRALEALPDSASDEQRAALEALVDGWRSDSPDDGQQVP